MTSHQTTIPLNFLGHSKAIVLGLSLLAMSSGIANAQLPPGAPPLPGVVLPQVTPPPLAANGLPETSGAATPPQVQPTVQAANTPGKMVLGEKIDVLTLHDLEDKLQASPNMIFISARQDYQMQLLKALNDKIATVGVIAFEGPASAAETRPEH